MLIIQERSLRDYLPSLLPNKSRCIRILNCSQNVSLNNRKLWRNLKCFFLDPIVETFRELYQGLAEYHQALTNHPEQSREILLAPCVGLHLRYADLDLGFHALP